MTEAVAEIRDRVRDVMRRRGVTRAAVFGSVARGEETPDSDIDFLVEFESGRTLLDLSGLRRDLSLVLHREVDVVTSAALHPRLRTRILEESVDIL